MGNPYRRKSRVTRARLDAANLVAVISKPNSKSTSRILHSLAESICFLGYYLPPHASSCKASVDAGEPAGDIGFVKAKTDLLPDDDPASNYPG